MMWQTARSILKRDPAAHSLAQVILTYPGLHALFFGTASPIFVRGITVMYWPGLSVGGRP